MCRDKAMLLVVARLSQIFLLIVYNFNLFQLKFKNVTNDCLKMKQSIEFKSDLIVYKLPKYADSPLFVFTMMYKSTQKTVHEERLVYDQSGMISQLGGILSLFLGFSFFSLISDLLDFTVKKNMISCICRRPPSPQISM